MIIDLSYCGLVKTHQPNFMSIDFVWEKKIELHNNERNWDEMYTSKNKACAELPAWLVVWNVGLTERSSGLSSLIWSGRMNSDIKDLLVRVSLPVEQIDPKILTSQWKTNIKLRNEKFIKDLHSDTANRDQTLETQIHTHTW